MRRLVTFFLVIPLLGAAAAPAASQSPTEELLAGMVTEEVEPGVLRVVNDGVRDLRSKNDDGGPYDVVAGHDGSVWLFDWPNRSVRLGEEAEYEWGGSAPTIAVGEVTSDGILWRIDRTGSIRSFDGRAWTERTPATSSAVGSLSTLKVGPEDTIWAVARGRARDCPAFQRAVCTGTVLISLDRDGSATTTRGWSDIYDGLIADNQLAVSPDGEVWLMGYGEAQSNGFVEALLRYDGQAWEVVAVPDDLRYGWEGQSFDIGADGALWAAVGLLVEDDDGLARLDDSGWTVFTEADGVRPWGTEGFIPTDHLHAAADGSVWVNAEGTGSSCGGVANFDGSTWTGYLTGLCVHDLDIAPDGAVWVRAGTFERRGGFEYWDPPDLYVITPEAVAGTE